jgi:hypothetical protein
MIDLWGPNAIVSWKVSAFLYFQELEKYVAYKYLVNKLDNCTFYIASGDRNDINR